MVGTNGETVLGSLSVHNDARIRQEYFIERDRLETAQGLDQDLYSTFAGAAFDLPVDERNTLTALQISGAELADWLEHSAVVCGCGQDTGLAVTQGDDHCREADAHALFS